MHDSNTLLNQTPNDKCHHKGEKKNELDAEFLDNFTPEQPRIVSTVDKLRDSFEILPPTMPMESKKRNKKLSNKEGLKLAQVTSTSGEDSSHQENVR